MKPTTVHPYLIFAGRCEEALDFYRTALGAQVDFLVRHKENPEPLPPGILPPDFENKILHATFRIGDTKLMASDGCGGALNFAGFSLSLAVSTEAEAERLFAALADGGQVTLPLAKSFWSLRFGMVTDRFGLSWMIKVAA